MAKEEKKAPKLRFNGYTNDWEHVKPKKYLKISKVPGSNGLIAKKLTVKLWGKGVVEKDTTFNGSENTKYFTRKSGQLIYGKLDFLHAAFGIVPQNLNNYESTADSPAFDINDVGDRIFLINYFLRPEFYLKNGEKANGSRKAKRIHEETFLNMPMQAPIKSEQEKIAKTLNSLNNTIQLHERKCEELTLIKKALLQKLFPKKDVIKPEVRYKNFNDAWEQRRFKDISKLSQGLQIAISKRFTYPGDGKLFYITNEFLNPNSTVKYYIDSPTKNVIAEKTDILMTRTGNTGKVVTDVEGVYHNNFFKISYNSSKIDRWFLYYLLNSYPIQREILVRAGNSTIPDLNHNDFYGIKIYIPTIEEQIKIGTFLTKVDSLIALHQYKLKKLKQLKKFLLQNMFI